MMTHRLWTVGYGGRKPLDFMAILQGAGVECVADVRLSPRGSMGSYTKANSPERGIQKLLADGGIRYQWFPQLGNPDRSDPEMRQFRTLVVPQLAVHAMTLLELASSTHTCLLCGCKRAAGCHRSLITPWFAAQGWEIIDLE